MFVSYIYTASVQVRLTCFHPSRTLCSTVKTTTSDPALSRFLGNRLHDDGFPREVADRLRFVVQFFEEAAEPRALRMRWLGAEELDGQGGVYAMRLTHAARLISRFAGTEIELIRVEALNVEESAS